MKTPSEYSNQCETCGSKGSETHARQFYQKIKGQWVIICSKCWEKHSGTKNQSR